MHSESRNPQTSYEDRDTHISRSKSFDFWTSRWAHDPFVLVSPAFLPFLKTDWPSVTDIVCQQPSTLSLHHEGLVFTIDELPEPFLFKISELRHETLARIQSWASYT